MSVLKYRFKKICVRKAILIKDGKAGLLTFKVNKLISKKYLTQTVTLKSA